MKSNNKHLILLGIRGIPAQHGGFETFAQYLSAYLVLQGWKVTVYCQEEGNAAVWESEWNGIHRIHIPVSGSGAFSTIVFDLRSIIHSLRHEGIYLTLGYNTAVFNLLHKLKGKDNVINMDGIEWKRQKWGRGAKLWFWVNERFGCWFGSHLVADHPKIAEHLATRVSKDKITMIPYGAINILNADETVLERFGLEKNNYAILIARAEPENSILEVVTAFSVHSRGVKLVVLGNYSPENNAYHRAVINAASEEVVFLGAIYEEDIVNALRFYTRLYVHGHKVGGTNPSLVEAIGAGNAILAHDNEFNRWVAKEGAIYFSDIADASNIFDKIWSDDELVASLQSKSRINYDEHFQWDNILEQYQNLLLGNTFAK